MADEILQQAIGLVKAGKNDEARGLLYHLVKTDPQNEMAWLWLSETMNDAQRRTGQVAPFSIIPHYTLSFLGKTPLSTIVAGFIGVLVVLGIVYMLGQALRKPSGKS